MVPYLGKERKGPGKEDILMDLIDEKVLHTGADMSHFGCI